MLLDLRHTSQHVGILGAGHLGCAIAETLLRQGLAREQLFVSHGSSPKTKQRLHELGLDSQIRDNRTLFESVDTLFLTIRPQAISQLEAAPSSSKAHVISCLAGVPRARLEMQLHIPVTHAMPSGPATLAQDKGIIALYPAENTIQPLLQAMLLRCIMLPDEDLFHLFTAGVCLPAALLLCESKPAINEAIEHFAAIYPPFREIHLWAQDVLPPAMTATECENYVRAMCTPGGITEAIVNSLRQGESLRYALQRGVDRSRELSKT